MNGEGEVSRRRPHLERGRTSGFFLSNTRDEEERIVRQAADAGDYSGGGREKTRAEDHVGAAGQWGGGGGRTARWLHRRKGAGCLGSRKKLEVET